MTGAAGTATLAESLRGWVARAGDADEHELCLALITALGDQVEDGDRLRQALSLLHLGRVSAAIRVLPRPDSQVPSSGPPSTPTELLRTACAAATGDAPALHALQLATVATTGGPTGRLAAELVAVVQDLRSDHTGADRSWRVLADRYGAATPAEVSRLVVAHVMERQGEDGVAVVRRVAEAATSLERAAHRPDGDARPTLAAADALMARGDQAGARLLLHLLPRRSEVAPAVRARDVALNPAKLLWQRRALAGALLAIGVLVTSLMGFPGLVLPLGLATTYAWRRWLPVPGLNRADSSAYRSIRRLSFNVHTGRSQTSAPDGGLLAIALLLGLVAGVVLGAALYSTMDTWPGAGLLASAVGMLAPVGFFAVARRWSRSRQVRARDRERVEHALGSLRDPSRCQCWDSSGFVDTVATSYAERHLAALPDPAAAQAASVAADELGHPVLIRRCPDLGLLWLHATLTTDGAVLLLRGALPQDAEARDASTGFYL